MYIGGFMERQHIRSLAPVMNDYGWWWWPNDIRGPWALKLPDICLTGEEKHRKTSPRKLVPIGDRTRARCVTGAHATTCPTEPVMGIPIPLKRPLIRQNFRTIFEVAQWYWTFVGTIERLCNVTDSIKTFLNILCEIQSWDSKGSGRVLKSKQ